MNAFPCVLPMRHIIAVAVLFGSILFSPLESCAQMKLRVSPSFEISAGSTYTRWSGDEPHSSDLPAYTLAPGLRIQTTGVGHVDLYGSYHAERVQYTHPGARGFKMRSSTRQVGIGGMLISQPNKWQFGVGVEHRWPVLVTQDVFSLGTEGREWIRVEDVRALTKPMFYWNIRVGYDTRHFSTFIDLVSAGANGFPYVGGTAGLVYSNVRLGIQAHLPI